MGGEFVFGRTIPRRSGYQGMKGNALVGDWFSSAWLCWRQHFRASPICVRFPPARASR